MPPTSVPRADDVRAAERYLALRMWGAWARRTVMLAILVAVFAWLRLGADYPIDAVVEFEMNPSIDPPPNGTAPAVPAAVDLVVTWRGAQRIEADGRRVFLKRDPSARSGAP